MKSTRRTLALLLALVMLVSMFPISAFAAENSVNNDSNAAESKDYYYKITFDSAAVGTQVSGSMASVMDADFNPYGMTVAYRDIVGSIKAHDDGSGNYFSANYTTAYRRDLRLSLVKGNTDYSIANGIDISFKLRWRGTGIVDKGTILQLVNFIRVDKSGAEKENSVLAANVDEATNDLVLTVHSGVDTARHEVARIPVDGKFHDIRVTYHDMTNACSVYVDGIACANGVPLRYDLRGADYVTTTYDADFFATRTPKSGAATKSYLELFALNVNSTLRMGYEFDVDDIYVTDGDYYANSFESAGTKVNSFRGTSVASNNLSVFALHSGVASGAITIAEETDGNGNKNKYLSLGAGSRINFKDYDYQFIQDGNWTVDFKLRASGAVNVLRLYDVIMTHQVLNVDADGNLKLGTLVVPDVKVPGTDSDEWIRITLSVLVDDDNAGKFDQFVGSYNRIKYRRSYRVALWVDGEYVGSSNEFGRNESTEANLFLNNYTHSASVALDASTYPDVSTLTLVADEGTKKTYTDANGDYYQLTFSGDSITAGVKIPVTGSNPGDMLGIFDKGSATGAIDDFAIYRGVGPKEYATDKLDSKGVIADVDFGKILVDNINHTIGENVNGTSGGASYVVASRTKSTEDYTRVVATASQPTYVTAANAGSGTSFFDLRAGYSGGKIFAAEWTVRNFTTAADMSIFSLFRQAKGSSSSVISSNIFVEANTSKIYFIANSMKYYL